MAITNGYCTLNQVKAALRITDTVDDALLEGAVESASRLIDGFAARNFYNAGTATRLFTAYDSIYVQTDDIAGTAITVQTSTLADGVFDLSSASRRSSGSRPHGDGQPSRKRSSRRRSFRHPACISVSTRRSASQASAISA
jgi:hypothetical protein